MKSTPPPIAIRLPESAAAELRPSTQPHSESQISDLKFEIPWAGSETGIPASVATISWRIELGVFAMLIGLLNIPLLFGQLDTRFVFLTGPVAGGEWWRVFTHPFVHVSIYHLLLDAGAFFILYSELRDKRRGERFAMLLAAGAGSLLASLLAAPASALQTQGLCGLSGIAHGLAAVSALEMIAGATCKSMFRLGLASLALVVGKSAFEAVTGRIPFAWLHLGWVGFPVAVCHAGGVLGALLAWSTLRTIGRRVEDRRSSSILLATNFEPIGSKFVAGHAANDITRCGQFYPKYHDNSLHNHRTYSNLPSTVDDDDAGAFGPSADYHRPRG